MGCSYDTLVARGVLAAGGVATGRHVVYRGDVGVGVDPARCDSYLLMRDDDGGYVTDVVIDGERWLLQFHSNWSGDL